MATVYNNGVEGTPLFRRGTFYEARFPSVSCVADFETEWFDMAGHLMLITLARIQNPNGTGNPEFNFECDCRAAGSVLTESAGKRAAGKMVLHNAIISTPLTQVPTSMMVTPVWFDSNQYYGHGMTIAPGPVRVAYTAPAGATIGSCDMTIRFVPASGNL